MHPRWKYAVYHTRKTQRGSWHVSSSRVIEVIIKQLENVESSFSSFTSANMAISSAGIRLSIWIAVFTCLTTVVIGLRVWAIHLTRKAFQLHDYLVITAYVSMLV